MKGAGWLPQVVVREEADNWPEVLQTCVGSTSIGSARQWRFELRTKRCFGARFKCLSLNGVASSQVIGQPQSSGIGELCGGNSNT